MSIVERTALFLYEKTKSRPLILHIDAIGFFKFGENKGQTIEDIINNKLEKFCEVLIKAEELGANIIIPTFSYSITSGVKFDLLNTKSEVGSATEYIRKKFPDKRTYDPIFSYLVFSKKISLQKDFEVKNFDSFGYNSLIERVFNMDGSIGSIGDVLWRTTEAHYIEKKLGVNYRFDKEFKGIVIDKEAIEHFVTSIFFCRDLNLNLETNFKPIINDLRTDGLVEEWCINEFCIEVLSIKKLAAKMKKKYQENKLYFTKEDNEN